MKEYFVYILRCSDKSYYVGVTSNVSKRLFEHQNGIHNESYTYSRRPLTCVYISSFTDVRLAIAWEKQIKHWSRKKKEALIDGNYAQLPQLSKKHFVLEAQPTCHLE